MKLTQNLLFSGLAILTLAVSLHAEEPSTQVQLQQQLMQKMPMVMDCGTMETIQLKLAQYNEIPFTVSDKSVMEIPMGNDPQLPFQLIVGKTAIFINPQTGSYSIVFKLPDEMKHPMGLSACIIGAGAEMKPAFYEKDPET